ncbi:4-diphosphocytidyl-2-C-methyl-D-erythritol kinase [hydrothermal vent metagenome]|uniref:4-(cytidine 5'-diphospho)-2-C-methyl-D-erythritol kinase n=1 Tax=hydrothermal vent metagenome TaxID=652676 RepID=A0A3B1AA80_9ZZZZ
MVKNKITRLARAKINLDLLVTGRREDGYHLLDSLVVFADYGDEISVLPSDEISLAITGPFATELIGFKDNIILKAARALKKKFNIMKGAEITLVKNLPVSSGIGGGSADAAAAIHALIELWQMPTIESDLDEILLSLGADVPVCMASQTMHMTGMGEKLRPITINFPVFLCLVNPGVAVSTSDIFKGRTKRAFSNPRKLPLTIEDQSQLQEILNAAGNDLEGEAGAINPVIKKIIAQIKASDDCLFAGMSGSGATCFGIFSSEEAARRIAGNINSASPGWWVKPVRLR